VNLSFACNTVLAAVQLYAAISSLSLALFASCIDAGESGSEIGSV
jgi:divalent metal cation (Fe/Co/Zn/Cd) transporter